MSTALSCTDLSFTFAGGKPMHFPDFKCLKGGDLLILGQSGTGKTTLLHLLAGLRKPSKGSINLAGQELSNLSGSRLDKFRGTHVGIVFQTPHFVKSLTVWENLMLPAYFSGTKPDKQRATDLLTRLGIEHKKNANPGTLSIGEQQRLGIARALIHRPAVVFADEPTSALDDANTLAVVQLLKETASESNSALVIVTHDNRLKTHFQNIITL